LVKSLSFSTDVEVINDFLFPVPIDAVERMLVSPAFMFLDELERRPIEFQARLSNYYD